jgi:hypothetical protein
MNDDNPSRRDASIIDRELHERGAKRLRKPHNAVLAQRHGPARTVRGLPHGAQDAMIGLRKPANGESRLKAVALGWAWFEEIKAGSTMQAIADREGVTQRRVAHLVDLAFLAPDIVRSIVERRQPPTLTADRLIKSRHRTLWSDQRAWISAI